MKRPQPDIGDVLRNQFIGDLSTVRKLKRLWGTTQSTGADNIVGPEIFTPRQYYHGENLRSDNFEKLFKMLGAYEDVTNGDYEGVRSAWLYFNKNKASELGIGYNDFVADNLNRLWWDPEDGERPEGLTLTSSVVISTYGPLGSDLNRVQQILNSNMTVAESIASLEENYEELWDLCKITQEGVGVINKGSITDPVNKIEVPDEDDLSPSDPWLAAITRYALRDNGIPCTIKNVSIGTFTQSVASTKLFYVTYVVDIEIPYKEFTAGQLFVQDIAFDLSKLEKEDLNSNSYLTKQAIKAMDSSDLEEEGLITRDYTLWEDESVESDPRFTSLWIKSGKQWYLKTEAFNNPREFGFTYKELSRYLTGIIDSGYKKKSIPAWKKFVAVVLVVVAFVLAFVPGAQGFSAKLIAVAKAILVASLVLTLAIIAFAVLGMEEWAAAFAEVSKTIEPLVILATIVLIFTGIQAGVEAAKEAALEKGLETTTSEILVDMLVGNITNSVSQIAQGAADVFAGSFTTNAALAFAGTMVKIVNFAVGMKLKNLSEKNKDLKAEYDELTAEMYREVDALRGFSRIYSKPATADWSIFASTFDMPYERGGGPLAMGNIQRTTKQALRKADYTDPAFAGILII